MTIDYTKTQQDLVLRRREISERQKAILKQKSDLDSEYTQLQQELVSVDHMLEGISFMKPGGPPPDFDSLGFGEKIETILKQTPVHLFPTQIRDELMDKGTKGSSPKNLLISIHNVLARIEKNLDVQEVDGRFCYKWKIPMAPLNSLLANPSKPNSAPAGLASNDDSAVKAFLEGKRRGEQARRKSHVTLADLK